MLPTDPDRIIISGAAENNLKQVSLEIPHYRLIVVTGVSGSGKSSLVYDVICREGQRLVFGKLSFGKPEPREKTAQTQSA